MIDRAWLDDALKNIPKSPCAYQTRKEIEKYYRNASIGDKATIAILNTIYCNEITEILGRNAAIGRVYIKSLTGSAFYMNSGANCYHPTAKSSLVVPSEAVISWWEANKPLGVPIGQITTNP